MDSEMLGLFLLLVRATLYGEGDDVGESQRSAQDWEERVKRLRIVECHAKPQTTVPAWGRNSSSSTLLELLHDTHPCGLDEQT